MRILFCNYEYPPIGGGGGVVNAALARELAKKHEVTVLTSRGLGLSADELVDGVRVVRAPVFFRRQTAAANLPSMLAYLPSGMWRGRGLVHEGSFDVINTHFVLPSGPTGDYLSRYSRTPNIVSVHGGDLYDPSKWTSPHRHWLLRAWIRRLLGRAACVVAQSRNTLERMQEFYTPGRDAIRIPLGIDRPRIPEATRSQFGFSEQDRLLITVGRLVSRKGIDQLVRVVKELGKDEVHLLIVGTGPGEKTLRQQAVDLGVSKQIHFLGAVDDDEKFRLLSVSDAFVSTSQHEGFGLVFVEAMAARLPVICYDNGGQTDFLVDGVTGGVVPLNDFERFVATVRACIEVPENRSAYAAENVRRAEEFFIDTCAARYDEVFQQVVEEARQTNARD